MREGCLRERRRHDLQVGGEATAGEGLVALVRVSIIIVEMFVSS
jgi:hypothetical protein